MKKALLPVLLLLLFLNSVFAQADKTALSRFAVRGFHLDLRIQVMTMPALKAFALKLKQNGMNTLVMEWEGTYPFTKHPLIPNRYAYTKKEVKNFIKYCDSLGIDVIPLQQSFGHVEYILRHERYKNLREDQKDVSQVCPLETAGDEALFNDLFTDLASTHTSKYIHIGGDETYLLGHDARCKAKAEAEGKSKLYTDYIKMLCGLVIKLGKRPVLWADIALKYPEAIKSLPKETVFVDWNYGWDLSHFGDHQKLMESGFEIWGSPALRSSPDNYNLTQWEKHFKNIRDFIPEAARLGYKGMIMTSWSTSGQYSQVFESEADMAELYAIRHVYPLSGFNILTAAYFETLKTGAPLDINAFVGKYARRRFGFDEAGAASFWDALKTSPYEIQQGEVKSPMPVTVQQLLDSAAIVRRKLYALKPVKNQAEFEHFKLMADIRVYYLTYQAIEKEANQPSFNEAQKPAIVGRLKQLLKDGKQLDERFATLQKGFLNPSAIEDENKLRNIKVQVLFDRLSGNK
ncbi:MAG TPA: beta-N-acetylhexosaminidase [Mucilaginibacter sp.]